MAKTIRTITIILSAVAIVLSAAAIVMTLLNNRAASEG